jgi:cytoskeletal protein CcmA (bactofilin family)
VTKVSKSVLGKTMTFEGEVRGDSSVRIHGRVQGRVDISGLLRVEAGGTAEADLNARDVEVVGEVVGNIRAQDRVEVFAQGRVTGDIKAPRVLIANGAVFKGNVAL